MLTEKDLQELENAARLILSVIERHRIHEEDAAERRALFRFVKKKEEWHSNILKFTKQEIESMPFMYKKLFITDVAVAHVRTRKDQLIEIRCQINGKKITATAKTLDAAKSKFLLKLADLDETTSQPMEKCIHFSEYAEEWLESVKKNTVKPRTFEDYLSIYRTHLFPTFGARPLAEITRQEVQAYLNTFVDAGKLRAAHKHRLLLKEIFDYAVEDDVAPKNPLNRVKLPFHEGEHGQALTLEEERAMIARCKNGDTRTGKAILFLLYSGLRRSELATAEIVDGTWIQVTTAKQRAGRIEKKRRIPISPRLWKVLPTLSDDVASIRSLYPNRLGRTFKEWFPAHHLHELRHTFITRAQECGISRELVSLWAGHKADNTMTTNVYTHFSEDFQLSEIRKFDYEFTPNFTPNF